MPCPPGGMFGQKPRSSPGLCRSQWSGFPFPVFQSAQKLSHPHTSTGECAAHLGSQSQPGQPGFRPFTHLLRCASSNRYLIQTLFANYLLTLEGQATPARPKRIRIHGNCYLCVRTRDLSVFELVKGEGTQNFYSLVPDTARYYITRFPGSQLI